MTGTRKILAAAVCAAFSAQASAQSSPEQALGQNGDAIRGYNQVQVNLDRAQRTPLEAVWLRAEVLEEMWTKNAALSQLFQGCEKSGTPKQGCMVSGRTFWRFTLAPSLNAFSPGLSAQAYRASPPESDPLPAAGGVYLVANAGAIGQKDGSVLLAAGTSAQLIDTAYPSILIEVKAPDDQPLLLGSLAASDIGKALALLTRQTANAKVATLSDGGRVTLQKTLVASSAPAPVLRTKSTTDFSGDYSALVATIETPIALAKRDGSSTLLQGVDTKAIASLDVAPKIDFKGDFTTLVAAVELPIALLKRDASRVPEMDSGVIASLDLAPKPDYRGDFTMLVAAVELPVALLKREAPRAPEMDAGVVAALDVAPKPDFRGDFTTLVAAVEMPIALAKRDAPRVPEMDSTVVAALDVAPKAEPAPAPIIMAAVAPKPINVVVDVAPAPSSNAAIARMRAEIEAEVARENARLAQTLQGRTTKRLAFGT
jgi:hypothetical protein